MFLSGTFLVVRPVHLHQHNRAAGARKSANMVSADMVSAALIISNAPKGNGIGAKGS